MAFGIFASLVAILGIVLGVLRRNRILIVGSVVALVVVIGVWAYFWLNPY